MAKICVFLNLRLVNIGILPNISFCRNLHFAKVGVLSKLPFFQTTDRANNTPKYRATPDFECTGGKLKNLEFGYSDHLKIHKHNFKDKEEEPKLECEESELLEKKLSKDVDEKEEYEKDTS